MTQVVHSTAFGGYAFVIAKFADGNVFCYYNGTLIRDFTAGHVWPWLYNATPANTLKNLARQLSLDVPAQRKDYSATWQTNTARTDIFSQAAIAVNSPLTQNLASAAGSIATTEVASTVAAINGVQAVGWFNVIAGNSGGSLSSVKVNNVDILPAPVAYTTSAQATVTAIVNAINGAGGSYTAAGIGTQVLLTANAAAAATANGYVVKTVTSGNFCCGQCALPFAFGTAAGGAAYTATGVPPSAFIFVNTGTGPVASLPSDFAVGKTYGGLTVAAIYTDLTALVAVLANAITSAAATNGGIVAAASGATLYLATKTTTSADSAPVVTIVNTPIGITVASSINGTYAALELNLPSTLINDQGSIAYFPDNWTWSISPIVKGGVSPFTYRWQIVSDTLGVAVFADTGTTFSSASNVVITMPSYGYVNWTTIFYLGSDSYVYFPAGQRLLVLQIIDAAGSVINLNISLT